MLKLWRNETPRSSAYWSSWKTSITRVEVASRTITMHRGKSYALVAPTGAAEDVRILVKTPGGGVVESSSAAPNYAVVLYRSDGITELGAADVWNLADDQTWLVNPNLEDGATALVRLWRNDNAALSAYWSSRKASASRVEVASLPITVRAGGSYGLASGSSAAENVRVVTQTAQGGVVETSSAVPNFAVVLYAGDGLTEVAAADIWNLADDQTWILDPNLREGDSAVVRVWRNDNAALSAYWSSWKTSASRVEVASQTITVHRDRSYTITSSSSAGESRTDVRILVQSTLGGAVETSSVSPNYAAVVYRSDGTTELHAADVWGLANDRTWRLTPSLADGEAALLRLWRCDDPSAGAYWTSWKAAAKSEVVSQPITVQRGNSYTLASTSTATERVRVVVENADRLAAWRRPAASPTTPS